MFKGEFKFLGNGFEYAASGENNFGIESITVYDGDEFITVDGEKVPLSGKVVNVDNILRVPSSVTEQFGLEVLSISIGGKHSTYRIYPNDNLIQE